MLFIKYFLGVAFALWDWPPEPPADSWIDCTLSIIRTLPAASEQDLVSAIKSNCAVPDPKISWPPVKVYWNVIMGDNVVRGQREGDIANSTIHGQIEVLNRDFMQTDLSFELADIKRVINQTWFHISHANSSEEQRMKNALGVMQRDVLNIYSAMSLGLRPKWETSWAYIPKEGAPTDLSLDGVVLNLNMIGSPSAPRHTLTHEVGHWIGLRHTFERGCDPVNDGVDDTPPHREGNLQCDIPIASQCGDHPPEPINNFMNILNDKCMSSFTPGQIERMRLLLRSIRNIKLRPLMANPSSASDPPPPLSGPAKLQHRPMYRLFTHLGEFDIQDDPNLSHSAAARLYAEGGDACIPVLTIPRKWHSQTLDCKTQADIDSILTEYGYKQKSR